MSLNSPDAYLNINNANLRVFGNVHTNQVHLGNMTVRPSYGLSTVTDVSNTTPDTIQFTNTHTAFTTTGNVTVGKDLTVSGNVEVGTANLFVDTVNSRIGVGTTEPSGQLELVGDSTTQEYPPGPMDDYETLIPGHGVFKVYASSGWGNWVFKPWGAFTKDTNVWISANPTYNVGSAGNGNDDGTAMSVDTFNGINGSWLKLKLPYTINLKKFKIQGRHNSNERFVDATIYASTDDNNWDQIRSIEMPTSYDYETGVNFDAPNTSKYYDHFLIHITRLQTGTGQVPYANIGEWRLFGTPGPTTLDKGSLTLGRTLDVPRISRYDVDTETPRPEKLVVDFDTTVNSSPTDISGKGNHGVFKGTAQYSPADKAFSFDGQGASYIYGGNTSGLPTGDAIYSMVGWMNIAPSISVTSTVIAFGSLWNVETLGTIFVNTSYQVGSSIGGDHVRSTNAVITPNTWHHIVAVKKSTGVCTVDTFDLYLDGVLITSKTYSGANRTQAIGSSVQLSIGGGFTGASDAACNGLISNPKIYSVALEASEVQKLYRLGRTGRSMVITDTAVGIGKTPEAQLDVRGTFKTSDMSVDGEAITFYNNNKGGTSNDGDDYAASALLNDYSAWTSIFKKSWIGGGSGWGTFWAGNNGALYRRESGDTNPNEYVFVGAGTKRFTFELNNGHAYFDAGLSQNAYDYAEYFEWEDGNPHNEDRRGYSVVLGENGKIKKATSDDEPTDIFGIVSGTSGIVGDAACYDWQGKYEVDEWGTRATDEVYQLSWTTEDGKNHNYDEDRVPEGVIVPENVSRRLYNRERITPDYDDTKQYIPRDKRKEWCTVGLLGKVRLRDGSPKNPNWRYLKTIAGKELWLIR